MWGDGDGFGHINPRSANLISVTVPGNHLDPPYPPRPENFQDKKYKYKILFRHNKFKPIQQQNPYSPPSLGVWAGEN